MIKYSYKTRGIRNKGLVVSVVEGHKEKPEFTVPRIPEFIQYKGLTDPKINTNFYYFIIFTIS